MEEIKLWEIKEDNLIEISKEPLDLENRLESWLKSNLSILLPDLFIIGTQVKTYCGDKCGFIDILAMNKLGDLVIIELKRGLTPREVVSQALEYASWVKELSYEAIEDIISDYYGSESKKDLAQLYYETFNIKLDEGIEINGSHRIIIVGSCIDSTTERIIKYLSSDDYGVSINAVTFNYYKSEDNKEFLAKSFLIPEEEIELANKKSQEKKARSESTFKILLRSGKLKVGDEVIYKPAINLATNEADITAKIITDNSQKCLEYKGSFYAFSALRRELIKQFGIALNPDWAFNAHKEWILKSTQKNLGDL